VWVPGILGATAWYRKLTGGAKASSESGLKRLLFELNDEVLKERNIPAPAFAEIEGQQEAIFEQKAVEYAVTMSDLEAPLALVSAGSGSCQIVGFGAVASFDAALKEGEVAINNDRAAGCEEWSQKVLDAFAKCDDLNGTQALAAEYKGNGEKVHIVLISGNYYTAVSAGIVAKGDMNYQYQDATAVLAKLSSLGENASTDGKTAAAAIRLVKTLEQLVGTDSLDNVRCLFARDWELQGKGFRTTWTAGWWLTQVMNAP